MEEEFTNYKRIVKLRLFDQQNDRVEGSLYAGKFMSKKLLKMIQMENQQRELERLIMLNQQLQGSNEEITQAFEPSCAPLPMEW